MSILELIKEFFKNEIRNKSKMIGLSFDVSYEFEKIIISKTKYDDFRKLINPNAGMEVFLLYQLCNQVFGNSKSRDDKYVSFDYKGAKFSAALVINDDFSGGNYIILNSLAPEFDRLLDDVEDKLILALK